MAGDRASVLRSVHQLLAKHEGLVEALGHDPDADTVDAGARIVGDDVRLESLPLPIVVLTFDGGDGISYTRGDATWQLAAFLYARTVYEAADVLDELEAAALAYTYDDTLAQPLSRFQVTGHERLEPVGPAQRLLAWRINLEASWLPA